LNPDTFIVLILQHKITKNNKIHTIYYNLYILTYNGLSVILLLSQINYKTYAILGIADVSVQTVSGVAPALPERVTVNVNYNATGICAEERPVVWEAIDPYKYGNDGPGVFTVMGTNKPLIY